MKCYWVASWKDHDGVGDADGGFFEGPEAFQRALETALTCEGGPEKKKSFEIRLSTEGY